MASASSSSSSPTKSHFNIHHSFVPPNRPINLPPQPARLIHHHHPSWSSASSSSFPSQQLFHRQSAFLVDEYGIEHDPEHCQFKTFRHHHPNSSRRHYHRHRHHHLHHHNHNHNLSLHLHHPSSLYPHRRSSDTLKSTSDDDSSDDSHSDSSVDSAVSSNHPRSSQSLPPFSLTHSSIPSRTEPPSPLNLISPDIHRHHLDLLDLHVDHDQPFPDLACLAGRPSYQRLHLPLADKIFIVHDRLGDSGSDHQFSLNPPHPTPNRFKSLWSHLSSSYHHRLLSSSKSAPDLPSSDSSPLPSRSRNMPHPFHGWTRAWNHYSSVQFVNVKRKIELVKLEVRFGLLRTRKKIWRVWKRV